MCEPMVAKARERMASGFYPHVKDVMVMDAHELAFEDASFDCVVAQFVITLVANPERVLSECARVLRPGGEIILVNHLYSERGMLAVIEAAGGAADPRARPAAGIPVRPADGLGAGSRRCRAGRAPAREAARRLHAGALPSHRRAGGSGVTNISLRAVSGAIFTSPRLRGESLPRT